MTVNEKLYLSPVKLTYRAWGVLLTDKGFFVNRGFTLLRTDIIADRCITDLNTTIMENFHDYIHLYWIVIF